MKNWTELENSSFFDANARERALGMVDKGTFTEFLNPLDRYCSPHLPVLGTAVEFDDGTVCGVGLLGKHPVFVVSMEGKFIGGAIGEVNGGKMVATIRLALKAAADIKAKYPEEYAARRPLVAVSFETGGVRLHEANAGLLAHAEVMDAFQDCRGIVPVVAVVGSKVGCFGGMGFVAAATDVIVMNEEGRIGLTGPEVIEQEMGKDEFDASNKALVYRTTGAKHKYIISGKAAGSSLPKYFHRSIESFGCISPTSFTSSCCSCTSFREPIRRIFSISAIGISATSARVLWNSPILSSTR